MMASARAIAQVYVVMKDDAVLAVFQDCGDAMVLRQQEWPAEVVESEYWVSVDSGIFPTIQSTEEEEIEIQEVAWSPFSEVKRDEHD